MNNPEVKDYADSTIKFSHSKIRTTWNRTAGYELQKQHMNILGVKATKTICE